MRTSAHTTEVSFVVDERKRRARRTVLSGPPQLDLTDLELLSAGLREDGGADLVGDVVLHEVLVDGVKSGRRAVTEGSVGQCCEGRRAEARLTSCDELREK
jgi:hypothetical protein